MAGLLTKGLKLSYKSTSSASTYTELTNLISFPDLGGKTDSVEVTTMDDAAHTFISGLKNYGESLDFTFLYDKTQYTALNALSGVIYWQVGIPDGTGGAIGSKITFTGEMSLTLSGKGTNEAFEYTVSIKPNSAMVFA